MYIPHNISSTYVKMGRSQTPPKYVSKMDFLQPSTGKGVHEPVRRLQKPGPKIKVSPRRGDT